MTGNLLRDPQDNKSNIFPGSVRLHSDQPCNSPQSQFWVMLFSQHYLKAMFYGGATSTLSCNFLVLNRVEMVGTEDRGCFAYERLGTGHYEGKSKAIRSLVKSCSYSDFYLV